ncbi:exopolyphosphatase [Vibrio tapetis subsp. quintayensis]|uniref:exopolyphosphatase n=1 Tax=Vibrio tapetis TaxID=52443 RepID=UPI0025B2E53C|nr:exopolyphosphatase [Vibrio tapetis]MDN3680148.1 exopolyphosphatase [Vibrio tapetis subsp. quintayensis]
MSSHSRNIAAIDLGSNSFHMVVAKVVGSDLQMVSRHKQRVRLAAGLDLQNNLSNESIQRGIDCLKIFAERLHDFELNNVRIVATHTLRQANNAHLFIQRAAKILPFPIEIISGIEEGRLIFLGVAHTQIESKSKLVIDIGGGSTEMIIGQGFDSRIINSKRIGCVSFTHQFFNDGLLQENQFLKAHMAVAQKLEPLAYQYKQLGWEAALGSSGTIKAIREVLIGLGFDDGLITQHRLQSLIQQLCEFNTMEKINLVGLTQERHPVFSAGVAILSGIMKELDINQLHYSDGALREGVLYEMEQRFERSDIRMRTTENLATKHHVDLVHANKVRRQATAFLSQVALKLGIKKSNELFALLEWAAMLHEVGLSISFKGFHKHSQYILQHTNMPGFNQEQQLMIATLTRFQRKSLKLHDLPEFNLFKTQHVLSAIRILRLAILLHGQRRDAPLPELILSVDEEQWLLTSAENNWLDHNRLLHEDLLTEQEYWHSVGWELAFS